MLDLKGWLTLVVYVSTSQVVPARSSRNCDHSRQMALPGNYISQSHRELPPKQEMKSWNFSLLPMMAWGETFHIGATNPPHSMSFPETKTQDYRNVHRCCFYKACISFTYIHLGTNGTCTSNQGPNSAHGTALIKFKNQKQMMVLHSINHTGHRRWRHESGSVPSLFVRDPRI